MPQPATGASEGFFVFIFMAVPLGDCGVIGGVFDIDRGVRHGDRLDVSPEAGFLMSVSLDN